MPIPLASHSGPGCQMGQGWKLILKKNNKTNPDLFFLVWSENVVHLSLLDVGRPIPVNPTWEGAERLVHSVRTASWRLMPDIGLLLASKTTARLIDATLTINNHLIHLAVITLIPHAFPIMSIVGLGCWRFHTIDRMQSLSDTNQFLGLRFFFEKSHIKHYQTTFSGWVRDAHALMLDKPI